MSIATACGVLAAISLNGSWDFRFEDGKSFREAGDASFVATDKMVVPGCFDAMPKWFMKRGTGLYRRTFVLDRAVDNAWLEIDGIGLYGVFSIDGREIGTDDLPWSRVTLATGPLAAGEHTLFAAVDNRFDWSYQKLVRLYYDFHCWGGFFRGVALKFDNRRLLVRTRDYRTGEVELEVRGGTAEGEQRLRFDGRREVGATFRNGRARVKVPDFKLWSPEHPNLHTVEWAGVSARFGVRQIEAKNRGIYLNGEKIFLKGANRHDQMMPIGVATPESTMLIDIQNLKAMGGNFFRGAHYPQSQRFLELCDELGVLVWEESLGWGNGQPYSRPKVGGVDEMTDAEFVAKQLRQTKLMVENSFNHPSVIIFAFMNELASDTPSAKAIAEKLTAAIRDEESGRLVTFACNIKATDVCNEFTDIVAINTYPGSIDSYPGLHDELVEKMHNQVGFGIDWCVSHFRKLYPEKPIMFSEMGVIGEFGKRDPSASFGTEEFQAEHHQIILEAMYANPDVCGIAFWQYFDTRTNGRECGRDGLKRYATSYSGLFTADRKPKLVVPLLTEWFKHKTPASLMPAK